MSDNITKATYCEGCGIPLAINAHQPGCSKANREQQIRIMLQPEPNGYGFTRKQAEAYIDGDYDPSDPTKAEYMKDAKPGWAAYLRAKRKAAANV